MHPMIEKTKMAIYMADTAADTTTNSKDAKDFRNLAFTAVDDYNDAIWRFKK